MTEAHPLRCETCENKDCDLHAENPGNINADTGDTYGHFHWYYAIIERKGCASHSSAGSDAVLEEFAIWDKSRYVWLQIDEYKKILRQQKEREQG